MATNSPDIKLYNIANMSCSLLTGHSGFVVTIGVSPAKKNVFASASKVLFDLLEMYYVYLLKDKCGYVVPMN